MNWPPILTRIVAASHPANPMIKNRFIATPLLNNEPELRFIFNGSRDEVNSRDRPGLVRRSREEEPGTDNQAEVAGPGERLGHRHRGLHLREACMVGLAAEYAIPDPIGDSKDFLGSVSVMRKVTLAEPIFDGEKRPREMDPVMKELVGEKPYDDPEPHRSRGGQAEHTENDHRHDRGRKPS